MISVIVPTRRKDHIDDCVHSIKEYTRDFELIIVDQDAGYNEKLNIGYKQSKGDYIVILHDDCEVTEGWLDELVDLGAFNYKEKGRWSWGDEQLLSFVLMSRSVAEKLFPFDEFYRAPWSADAELGKRIQQLGLSVKKLEGKIIHHHSYGAGQQLIENEEYFNKKWSK